MKTTKENKSKEPFDSQQTPEPPQVMNPENRDEKSEAQVGRKDEKRKKETPKDTGRRLGESPTEITDETTI